MKTAELKARPHSVSIARRTAILLLAAGMQTLLSPSLHAAEAKKDISDSGITSAVNVELTLEKGVFPNAVDVKSSQGIVTLSGPVDNLLAKDRAVKIAESIRGVRGVIDRMTVMAVARPDGDVRRDILTALLQDPATASYQVAVSVQDLVATLSGSVGSYLEQQLVARIAKGVIGVKDVRNGVTINYLAIRTDPEMAADVRARLQWDIWINGDLVNAAVKDGKVTLTGIAGSAIAKSRAYEDAWVTGVRSVDDSGLKIEPWARDEARRQLKFGVRADVEIKQALQAAFRADPRVAAFSPDVIVEGGVAILGGAVGNVKARTAAEQDANNIVGVWRVANNLKVRPNGRPTDAEAEKQLKAALSWDPLLEGASINVAVLNRVAYLSGAVDSGVQKVEAQDVASRINGVALIRNHLKVEPVVSMLYYDWPYYGYYGYNGYFGNYGWPYDDRSPYLMSETFGPQPYQTDEEIKKQIEDAFFWSPFVDRGDITVTVHGGVATLSGTVGSWIGWGEADKDAHKSGATAVRNQVKVKKGAWL
jgi:osmotically-inducible protein OsmY